MKKILCIIRVSTDNQEMESQHNEMLAFLRCKGYTDDDIYWLESAGASARSLNKKYLDMLDDIKTLTKDIKCVAVWHLNRLGRIESKLMEMKEYFISNSIQVFVKNPEITLLDNDGKANPAAEISWSIFATMVKFETEEMMSKFKRGKAQARSEGRYIGGGIPFGYSIDDNGYFIVDSEQSMIMKNVYTMYMNGASNVHIRDYFASVGYPFLLSSIKRMLDRDIYKDVIGEELWNKYLEFRQTRKQPKKSRKYSMCEHLIICPVCGKHFYVHTNTYRCVSNMNTLKSTNKYCTCKVNLTQHRIDCIAVESCFHFFDRHTHENGSVRLQNVKDLISVHPMKLKAIQSKLDTISDKLERYADNYAEGLWSKKKRDSKIAETLKEKSQLENELKLLNARYEQLIKEKNLLEQQIVQSIDNSNNMDNMSKIELYNLVHQYISHIELVLNGDYDRTIIVHSPYYNDVRTYRTIGCGGGYRLYLCNPHNIDEMEDITRVEQYNRHY